MSGWTGVILSAGFLPALNKEKTQRDALIPLCSLQPLFPAATVAVLAALLNLSHLVLSCPVLSCAVPPPLLLYPLLILIQIGSGYVDPLHCTLCVLTLFPPFFFIYWFCSLLLWQILFLRNLADHLFLTYGRVEH